MNYFQKRRNIKEYLINKFPFILSLNKLKNNKIKIDNYNCVMLHNIHDNLTLDLWIKNIKILKEYFNFTVIPKKNNNMAITIDDGFANIKPFLDFCIKESIPVVLFISPLGIEDKIYPYLIFIQFFRKIEKGHIFKYKNYEINFITNNKLWRSREVFKFNRFLLKNCSYKEYIELGEKLIMQYSELFNTIDKDLRLLNKKDIEYYSKYDNISVQSHGLYHFDYNNMTEEELKYELEYSKNKLEEITNKKVKYFAYPYGHYNDNVVNLTKMFYEKAFIVGKDNNKFHINRIGIDGKEIIL